jgi:hypothetical protein
VRWETESLIDAGDRVLIVARMKGHSKAGSLPVDWRFAAVYSDFRGRTFAEVRFLDPDDPSFADAVEEAGAAPCRSERGTLRDDEPR